MSASTSADAPKSRRERDEIDLAPDDGWGVLDPLDRIHATRSFVRNDMSEDRFALRYYRRASDGALVGKVRFGPGCVGPPGHAHGGSMAALLDDAMGIACWAAGYFVVAAKIEIRFRRLLPLDAVVQVEALVGSVDARHVHTRGRLFDPATGRAFSTGEGTFARLEGDRLASLFGAG